MLSHFFHHFPSLFLSLIFFHILPAGASDTAALLNLRTAVGGRTRSWNLSDPNPCSWTGVICDKATGSVTELRLPGAGLRGQIPPNTLGNLTSLRRLSLRSNYLSGSLPSDLGSCTQLQYLFLQDNSFSGEIPATLFSLNNLVLLVLSGNQISGNISPEFNNFTNLTTLYLQNNNLTGSIPQLNNLSSLKKFNVSYNNLSGSVPSGLQKFPSDSFTGNFLCGSPLSPCPSVGSNGNDLSAGAIAGIVIGSVIGLLLILIVVFIIWRRCSRRKTQPGVETPPVPTPMKALEIESRSPESPTPILERENSKSEKGGGNEGMVFLAEGGLGFGLEELLRASAEVLGKGTFGSCYRAYLEGGIVVVVKRLRHVCVREREFSEKAEGLGKLRHENLVALKAYYYGREEKLLVYESMPLGSLSALLHGNRGADRAALTWQTRTKIAYGAARGICYLHSMGHNFSHGNIKSSNILLNHMYTACVSDFCINQLISPSSTLNRHGYCAPEVTDSHRVSHKSDVYSFGVLLLELVTAKAPTGAVSSEDGLDLPRWVKSVVQENGFTIGVVDDELVRYQDLNPITKDQMVQILQLGVQCTSVHPDTRPMMAEVTTKIEEICGWR